MNEIRKALPKETNELSGQFLNQLFTLIRLVSLYDFNNEIFDEPLNQFALIQKKLLAHEGKLDFRFIENEAFLKLTRIRFASDIKKSVLGLIYELREHHIGGFVVNDFLTSSKTKEMLRILHDCLHQDQKGFDFLDNQLKDKSINEIQFFPYQEYTEKSVNKTNEKQFLNIDALKLYAKFIYDLELLISIAPGQNSNLFFDQLRKTQRNIQSCVDLTLENPKKILLLNQIQTVDNLKALNTARATLLSICLGNFIGLKRTESAKLAMCALFHHRSNWHFDQTILEKGWEPYLNLLAFAVDHAFNPSICRRILCSFHWQLPANGKGDRPKLKVEVKPDLFTRIISIAAQYTHLTSFSNDPKEGSGLTPSMAIKYMFLKNQKELDPNLLRMFVNLMGVYPVGTLVRLNSDEIAMVQDRAKIITQIQKPQVLILRDSNGKETKGEIIDLTQDDRFIVNSIAINEVDINVAYFLFNKRFE